MDYAKQNTTLIISRGQHYKSQSGVGGRRKLKSNILMVKISGPLLSESAHGSIAKTLTYSKRRSGQQARRYNKPKPPASAAQRGQRRLTEFLVAQWQNMTAPQKATWAADAQASGKNLSGYHYFLREAQHDPYTHCKLVAHFSLNEKIGEYTYSTGPRKYRMRYHAGPGAGIPIQVTGPNVKCNKAVYSSGDQRGLYETPAAIECPHYDDYSLELFFRMPTSDDTPYPCYQGAGAGVKGYRLSIVNHKIRFIWGDQDTFISWDGDVTVDDDKWHVAQITLNRSSVGQIYVDGKATGPARDITGVNGDVSTPEELRFGWYGPAGAFYVDEFCAYKRLLSLQELATRYEFITRKI